MPQVSKPATTRLAYRCMLKLRARSGERIDCVDGSVWITQDGDPRDVVLDAGQSFTLDRDGTTIVYALMDAAVAVRPAPVRASRAGRDAVRRLRALMTALRSTTWARAAVAMRRG